MLGRILKVVNKVRRSVVRIVLGRLWLFGNGKPVSFFRLCLECSHNMEIKRTLGQRQRYPLPSRSLWPLTVAAVVTDELSRTEHNLRRSVFKNILDNFFVIIGNGEFNHTGIKCSIPWQNLFMEHFKFVSWQSGGSARTPAPPSPVSPITACQQQFKSLKPPISMCSSDKIVYAPRAESGHANSRKVRSTWPKVIVTESYLARWHPSAYGLGPSFPRSTAHDHLRPRATNLTLAVHSPAFGSRRVMYYFQSFILTEWLPLPVHGSATSFSIQSLNCLWNG